MFTIVVIIVVCAERKLKMKVDVIGNTKREKKVVPKGTFEDTINLEVLMQLKRAFKSADKDGGGDLCCEEFVRAFTGILGDNSEPDDLKMMFMKIDANADGTVDWDEFSSYMLLQNQGKQTMLESETHAEYSEPHERMLSLEQERNQHRDMIDRILYLPAGDRWATTSRDGTIRLWSGKDLHHLRTLRCGKAWVTDLGILPRQNKLVASTFSRVLRVHDMTSLEVVGKMTELEHTPLTLDCWTHTHADEVTDRVATGDNGGFVTMYKMLERDDDDKGMETKDHWRMERLWKVSLHTDWVSKVRFMSDLNVLCSASLDRTLCLYDVERRGTPRRLVGHSKGVYSFDWSKSFKFIASCGLDRHVMLWNPFSGKSMGSLVGHSASIQDVLIIERENQIVSVGVDKVIKVWYIRSQFPQFSQFLSQFLSFSSSFLGCHFSASFLFSQPISQPDSQVLSQFLCLSASFSVSQPISKPVSQFLTPSGAYMGHQQFRSFSVSAHFLRFLSQFLIFLASFSFSQPNS
jgi:WD40 repeat protein